MTLLAEQPACRDFSSRFTQPGRAGISHRPRERHMKTQVQRRFGILPVSGKTVDDSSATIRPLFAKNLQSLSVSLPDVDDQGFPYPDRHVDMSPEAFFLGFSRR